jgi:FkbM family methyltransferase
LVAPITHQLADALARLALRSPLAERALVAGTRNGFLRQHLHLGAIAQGYSRVLGRREIRIAEMDGYRFYVNVAEDLGIGPYFFRHTGAVWPASTLVRPGDICVDAGANAGHHTFLLASLVGATGRVFAFEPNPEFADLVRKSVTLNGFENIVRVDPRALFSVSGESRRFLLSVNPTNTGTSSLVDHGWYVSKDHAIDVSTVTFDDFAEEAGVDRFRLVKIDVERAEEFLIAGAARVLSAARIDYVIIEMFAGDRAGLLLREAGYRGFFLQPTMGTAAVAEEIEPERFGDFLFVRPGLPPPEAIAPTGSRPP